MNLTDQERFYRVLDESGLEDECFPQLDYDSETYFEDTEFQASLIVYNLENVNDVRGSLNTVLVEESFKQLKEECVKAILKSLISQEEGGQHERHVKDAEIRIPEFIYNF